VKSVRWAWKRFVTATDKIKRGHSGGRLGLLDIIQGMKNGPREPKNGQGLLEEGISLFDAPATVASIMAGSILS
jgi:hypothetical protein